MKCTLLDWETFKYKMFVNFCILYYRCLGLLDVIFKNNYAYMVYLRGKFVNLSLSFLWDYIVIWLKK